MRKLLRFVSRRWTRMRRTFCEGVCWHGKRLSTDEVSDSRKIALKTVHHFTFHLPPPVCLTWIVLAFTHGHVTCAGIQRNGTPNFISRVNLEISLRRHSNLLISIYHQPLPASTMAD